MESVPSSGALGGGYPDSVDSSPRSRGGDSWDEPFQTAAAASRLRLMCSYGGRIVPRPTDRSLCYLGGETRIVVVDRHASLADLHARLSRTLLGGHPFSLKYQLPNEDLDSLISVSTDEDLENMIDEYDRILASKPEVGAGGGGGSSRTSRIRLFLFPSKPDSSSSIGSLLDDSTKSETWFVDALNSAVIDGLPRGITPDSASVNCLLGLEDDSSTHSRPSAAGVGVGAVAGAGNGDQKLSRQDVQSVPDSPIIDKSSSFGSTSSAPSLSNLPPIRVRADDRQLDHRIPGLEDHFAHMILSSGADQQPIHAPPPIQLPRPIPVPAASGTAPTFTPSDNPNWVFSDDDKSDHGGSRKHQQPKLTTFDAPISDSSNRQTHYQERSSPGEPKRDLPVSADTSYRTQQVPFPDAGYVYPTQMQQPQPQQTQQQQFVPANAHYIQHTPAGAFVPVPSYYPIQQPQQSHQVPMYFLPVHQNVHQNPSPYNLSAMPPPPLTDPTTGKPAVPVPQLPVKQELPPANLYRTTAVPPAQAAAAPPQQPAPATSYPGMGYHLVHHHHHHPSQSPATVANYGYEFADPGRAHQVYYSQTTSPPSAAAPHYQNMGPAVVQVTDVGPAEMKQNRAS